MFEVDVFLILCQVLVAVLGTAARWLSIKEKEKSLIAEVVVAAFAAILVYAFFTWQSINVYISFLVSGGIGYQGTKGLDVLLKMIAKKGGLDVAAEKPSEANPARRSTERLIPAILSPGNKTTKGSAVMDCKNCAHAEVLYRRDKEDKFETKYTPIGCVRCTAPRYGRRAYFVKADRRGNCAEYKRRERGGGE